MNGKTNPSTIQPIPNVCTETASRQRPVYRDVSRVNGFETAKSISCFAVILVHINPGTFTANTLSNIGVTFVVPFFLLASLRLFVPRALWRSTVDVASLVFRRIVVPFFSWSLIYVLLRALKGVLNDGSLDIDLVGSFIFGNATAHLYFLPLLTCTQAAAMLLINFWRRRDFYISLFASTVAAIYLAIGYQHYYLGWAFIPGIAIILVIFFATYMLKDWLESSTYAGAIASTAFVATQFYAINQDNASVLGVPVAYIIAGSSFYIASFSFPKPPILSFPDATYGIFLSHILFLEAIETLLFILQMRPEVYTATEKVSLAVVIYYLGVAFTRLARRHSITKRLLLGE